MLFWIITPISNVLSRLFVLLLYRKGDRDQNQHLCHKLRSSLWHWNGKRLILLSEIFNFTFLWHYSTCSVFFFNHHMVFFSCRNTLLTFSSVKAGKTNDFALKARWRCFPWIISWPVTSGLRTPSSSTGRNPSHTIWPHLTSCCGWRMMGLCSTPWGKNWPFNRAQGKHFFSSHSHN